jgi:hypothetical protein
MSSPVLTPLELPKSGSKVLVITAHPEDVDFGDGGQENQNKVENWVE